MACVHPASAVEADAIIVTPLRSDVLAKTKLEALSDLVVVAMSRLSSYRIITKDDIDAQLQRDKMKDLLACNSVQCAAELGGAIGARYLLTGSVRKLGSAVFVNLSLIDTKEQRTLRGQGRVEDKEDLYASAANAAVREVLKLPALPPPTSALPAPPSASASPDRPAAGLLFSESFRDNSRAWPTYDDGKFYDAAVTGGYYVMETKNDKCSMEMVPLPSVLPSSFDIEWKTQWRKGVQDNAYGLVLGSSRQTFYHFGASGNGQTVVWLTVNDAAKADPMPWKVGTAATGDGTTMNLHRIEVRGPYITYFTNNVALTRFASEIDIHAGLVGLRVCGKQRAAVTDIRVLAR
jgi:TolB-like protein